MPPVSRSAGPNWHQMTTCIGLGLDVFYGVNEHRAMTPTQLKAARGICRHCPARADCLREALVNEDQFGIWGGFTGPERIRILKIYGDPELAPKQRAEEAVPEVIAAMYTGTLETQVVML